LNDERFREGCPEDLISLSTGYDFALEDDEAVDYDVNDRLISAIFKDANTCIYTLKIYAACLYGLRKYEEFYLLTGVSTLTRTSPKVHDVSLIILLSFPAGVFLLLSRFHISE
jgi:hypothetical protein